jgi:Holliday junction DNA helicase RuvA
LAVRLLTELREKAGAMPSGAGVSAPAPAGSLAADALSALNNLGYRRVEAQPALERVVARLGETATLDTVIRECLRELAK